MTDPISKRLSIKKFGCEDWRSRSQKDLRAFQFLKDLILKSETSLAPPQEYLHSPFEETMLKRLTVSLTILLSNSHLRVSAAYLLSPSLYLLQRSPLLGLTKWKTVVCGNNK